MIVIITQLQEHYYQIILINFQLVKWTNYTGASGDGFSSGTSSAAKFIMEIINGYWLARPRITASSYNANNNPWSDSSQISLR